MKKRHKFNLENKLIRINYIKTELNQLVKKLIFRNTNVGLNYKITNLVEETMDPKLKYSVSNQRIFCAVTSSPKIVTKKYKLGRFVLSKLANNLKISGFYKRGW